MSDIAAQMGLRSARRLTTALAAVVATTGPPSLLSPPPRSQRVGIPWPARTHCPEIRRATGRSAASGDPTIQGYATSMSVNAGQTESFKIKTTVDHYHIDILRLGYYGGNGARKVASNIRPTATCRRPSPHARRSRHRPDRLRQLGGLRVVDRPQHRGVGRVPRAPGAGRHQAGGDSQIPFVVRNDASHSDVLSADLGRDVAGVQRLRRQQPVHLHGRLPAGQPPRVQGAYAVSYNRPFDASPNTIDGASYLWYAEYQMIRFLEANGYDVSYISGADLDRQRLRCCSITSSSCRAGTTSTGQATSAPTSRPRSTRA